MVLINMFSTFFAKRFLFLVIFVLCFGFFKISKASCDEISFRLMLERSEVLESGYAVDYLEALMSALLRSAVSSSRAQKVRVHLIREDKIVAQTFPSADIVISTGLILGLQSEAELAFVLGHELGHLILSHFDKEGAKNRQQIELEADSYGLNILVAAGYIPHASLRAIQSVYSRITDRNHKGYPELAKRIDELSARIARLPQNSLARTSRRDFVKLQHVLSR